MACISRYHLQNRWSEMTTYIMRYHLQRWRLGKHGIISATDVFFQGQRWRLTISSIISRDDRVIFKVSSPEMTACFSRYHLQNRWSEMTTYIMRYHLCKSSILPGSEMTADNIKYHLQRWRLAFHGIISRDDGAIFKVSSPCFSRYHLQRWWSDFQGIISRDEGLLFTVSSPESLVRDDYVYQEVSSLLL